MPNVRPPHRDRPFPFTALLLALVFTGGCGLGPGSGPAANLAVWSQANPLVRMAGGFDTGLYAFDEKNNLTVLLLDGPVEQPAQAVTIRVLWVPRAGRTPIDPSATNATIHHVIFTGPDQGQVGIYSGAGYVFPKTRPGSKILKAGVWQSTLILSDHSEGFGDLLGRAAMEGTFTARRDEADFRLALHSLNRLIGTCLGRPRMVAR